MLTEYRPESLTNNEAMILGSIYCRLFSTGVLLKDELAMLLIILSQRDCKTAELKLRMKCGLPAIKATRKSLEAILIARFIKDDGVPRAVLILPILSLDDFDRDDIIAKLSKIVIENRMKYDNNNYNIDLITEHSNDDLNPSIFIKNFFKRVGEISTVKNNPDSLIVSHPIITYSLPTKEDPNFWWHVNASSIKVNELRDTEDSLDAEEYRKVIKMVESYMGKKAMKIFREKWRNFHKIKEEYANLVFYNKESTDRFDKVFNILSTKKQEEVMEKCKKMYINYDEPEYQEHQKYGIDFTPFTDSDYIDIVDYFGEIPLDLYQKIVNSTRDEDQWIPINKIVEEWENSKIPIESFQENEEIITNGFSFFSSCQDELVEFYFEENFIKSVDEKINHKEFIKIYGGDSAEYTKQIFPLLKGCEDRGKTPEESIEEVKEMFINE